MPTTSTVTARTYTLGIIKRAVAACIAANQPVILHGSTGVGKSSVVKQLTLDLGGRLFDFRSSDKNASDIGGIPFPVKQGKGTIVEWLVCSGLIPFATEENPGEPDELEILFLDEIDRVQDRTVLNVLIQLILDRCVNGHKLRAGVRIVAAANGSSDSGTVPLTRALIGRTAHLYVDSASTEAIDGWQLWARENAVPAVLTGFARFRPELFTGKQAKFIELQRPEPRTSEAAVRLLKVCRDAAFGEDVTEACVFGAIGQEAGRELLAIDKLLHESPSPEEVEADPLHVRVPDSIGVQFALCELLIRSAAGAKADGSTENRAKTKAYSKYVARWHSEQAAYFFKSASASGCPSVVNTTEYARFESSHRL